MKANIKKFIANILIITLCFACTEDVVLASDVENEDSEEITETEEKAESEETSDGTEDDVSLEEEEDTSGNDISMISNADESNGKSESSAGTSSSSGNSEKAETSKSTGLAAPELKQATASSVTVLTGRRRIRQDRIWKTLLR